MKLTVSERINTLSLLPSEGNFATLKVLNELKLNLSFTEKEIIELNVKATPTADSKIQYTWDAKKEAKEVEIKIGEVSEKIIIDALKNLDKSNKLTNDHYSIYEKFVLKES